MTELVDTHAHVDEIADIPAALAAARAAEVVSILAVGQGLDSNRRVLELASAYPDIIRPALGYHPWNIRAETVEENLAFIEANASRVAAIGEIGLDYHKAVRAGADKHTQHEVLTRLLSIAKEYDKPVSVHSRYAWRDALDIVKSSGVTRAVFHWYTGPSSVLRDIISGGYFLSITPAIDYHEEHRRAAREVPLGLLLLETDAPVVYGRGRPAEFASQPADVARVMKSLARLRQTTPADIAKTTTGSARRLFNT